jgi:hypothetical protein
VNLITNSDFESGTADWTAAFGGSLAPSTAQAHGGSQSALVTGRTTGTYQGAHFDLTNIVEPGATYSFSAFARLGGASSDTLKLTARIRCEGQDDKYRQVDVALGSDSAWTELAGELTFPHAFECSVRDILLYVEGPATNVDIYVDDVSAILSAEAPVVSNLITNSDFEAGVGGWSAAFGGTLSASSAQAHGGTQSAAVTGRTGAWQGAHHDLTNSVELGTTYSFSAFTRLGGPATTPVKLTARIQCEGPTEQFVTIDTVVASDTAWSLLSGNLVMPAAVDCTLTNLVVYVEGADTADIYLDDVWAVLEP